MIEGVKEKLNVGELEPAHECAKSYEVVVHNRDMFAFITHCPCTVYLLSAPHCPQILGFTVKWSSNFKHCVSHLVASLQPLHQHCCLIYHIGCHRCLPGRSVTPSAGRGQSRH
ncbi:hypothetical protein NL676_028490 [Syzygium grande]|nr:hypothetical protein NL676_028490 [Syzygium grande]